MKRMKKGIFLLVLAGILGIVSCISSCVAVEEKNLELGRNGNVAGLQRERENSIDILVLGDSESYTAISPMRLWEKTGISSYICGQTGQKISEAYYLLKEGLQKQSPRLVILETDLLFRYQGMTKEAQSALAETGRYYFPIFRYHNNWKFLLNRKLEKTVNYKGFTIRKAVAPYGGGDYMLPDDKREEIARPVRWYLDRMVRFCEKKGIPMLLLSAPSPVNYNYQRHNTISDYAKKKQIPYLDLNLKLGELQIDWGTDSLDQGDHLNLSGAHKVTDYLSTYLEEMYSWTDHRGESSYKNWNIMAEAYEKQAEKALRDMENSLREK